MNIWKDVYNQKLLTADEIAKQIESNTMCATVIGAGEPVSIPEAIANRAINENLNGIIQITLLSISNNALWENTDLKGKFDHISLFIGSDTVRKAVWDNKIEYIPAYYHQMPSYYEDYLNPDVFYAAVSPMDEHGYFSFGVSGDCSMTLKKAAKKIFLEVNENMPRTHGNCFIHINEVDAVCEHNRSLPELSSKNISDVEQIIGDNIAELVPDGATLQLGIGGIPNAAAVALKNKYDLGIHSELFTESMVDLIEQGIITNSRKTIHEGKSIVTFALGSKRMYDFINDNIGVEFHPVNYVNDPYVIGMNDNLISINSCLEVDLFGQVSSESLGPRQYTGVGGQVDFVRGAAKSNGGKSIIAIQSTAKNETITKIKPILTAGSIVTTPRNEVDYIVTEYGVARLKCKSIRERVKELINISHPKFREELSFEARKMNLI
ncbi:acetyl-CoA hydrolase/transferase family protein [Sedimentibacter hydroxybenzoicus DSM 7310]|uniref:Acetyl-CoA hydrolase/transferase family protein n=1 Tax=Sedimentibacter hydroxybenzoicus DSM 7310 TaxID=1123245 RepID=A0A974GWP0_SEDHY|nr:acetyl-CoA hydrolase/transferase family protein [Sedimentibacter hydroxybenzoicus]NYB74707.1 acetyl-CoA hydrolase/transferase family protein [Sedimentibacter hydroxybenzoicus DSM 7310]